MKFSVPSLMLAFAAFHAAPALAADHDRWRTQYTFAGGTTWSAIGNVAYDDNHFSRSGSTLLEDNSGWRRKEFGTTLKKKDVYDASIYYDFESNTWLDVFVRFETLAMFGTDYGKVRLGYSKVPVGFENLTSSRATSFMENALPMQMSYEGRRTGIDWALVRPGYLFNTGYYFGQDLHGDNPGTTTALRAAWTPAKTVGNVIHIGIAASQENPETYTDGRGRRIQPSTRLRSRPEAGLTNVRLVDTGTLSDVERIRRAGLEALWIHGPWSLQGELVQERVARKQGLENASADGYYVFGSWAITGESRPYNAGTVGNIKPAQGHGAVELLLRHSTLDLDDVPIRGGRQKNWTLGANWYLTSHFKFQANYVRVDACHDGVCYRPSILEMRAQVHF